MSVLEDAAMAYVFAQVELRQTDGPGFVAAHCRMDACWHDLLKAAGYRCECDPGTCPTDLAASQETL